MKKKLIILLIGVALLGGVVWLIRPQDRKASTPSSASETQPSQTVDSAPTAQETTPSLLVQKVLHTVPFTSQAPLAEWRMDVFQNACEEASVLMAVHWAKETGEFTKAGARAEILKLSAWEEKNLGHAVDTDAADTQQFLLHEYAGITTSELQYDFSLEQLKNALSRGIIIVPTNGRKLGNPNFTSPGPLTHMLVIIGYDPERKEFITNDPGTRLGKSYHYKEAVLFNAIRDYPTEKHLPITTERKAMIIVEKP